MNEKETNFDIEMLKIETTILKQGQKNITKTIWLLTALICGLFVIGTIVCNNQSAKLDQLEQSYIID